MGSPPGPPPNPGRSWALWKKLAEKHNGFGNPDAFFGDSRIADSRWVTYLDGLGVDWPIRVDLGAPRLALAPSLAFAQHFDETDLDDDAGGSPGERLLANELGVGCTLASRLRVEGDEPIETVEEIRQVHRGNPKQRQFLRVSVIGVTASDRMILRLRKPE